MKLLSLAAAAATAATMIATTPVAADPGRGHGRNHHASPGHVSACPPGLAKKRPACIPPGQARKHDIRYGNRVGDVLRIGNYTLVRDPYRYDLQSRSGWNYYRDDDRIYRVDRDTQKILAVMNLINAFN